MLLIVQNGYIDPCISKYLDQPYIIVKSFQINVSEIDIKPYSVVIILGGYQSVTQIEQYPSLQNVVHLIKRCIEAEKPLFGICLGCQLIAYALGCEVKSTGKLNVGFDVEIMDRNNVFRCHTDYIVPNDSIQVLEWFDQMPYLYKSGDVIYGIQCHPDITPGCIRRYVNHSESITYAESHVEEIDQNNIHIMGQILDNLLKI